MAAVDRDSAIARSHLWKLLSHPLRCRCQTMLCERTASPNELATLLHAKLGDVAYHVRELEKHGCVELVDTAPRRGAMEHYYRATQRTVLDDDEYAELPIDDRLEFAEETFRLIAADALTSLADKTFVERTDHHTTRLLGLVDEEGWEKIRDIYAEAYQKVDEELQAVAGRRATDPTIEAFPMRAALMLFEMPWSGQ